MFDRRAYILKETVISIMINVLIGAAFFLGVFHGQSPVPLWSSGGVVLDTLPQGFMVGLMSVLPPGIITRSRIRGGKLVAHSGPSGAAAISLRSIFIMAVLAAIAGMICLTAIVALLSTLSGAAAIPFGLGLLLKPLAGGIEAAVITPLAIGTMLNRVTR